MNKEIISQLKKYNLVSSKEQQNKIIALGKEKIIQNQRNRHSYFILFSSTVQFIPAYTWIIQFIILSSGILVLLNSSYLQSVSEIMQFLTSILLISIIFFVDELFKSFTTGMWELEQTFKYDLRQHVIIKLFIFGIVDMFFIISLSLVTKSIVSISLLRILIYLIVPYNIICIVLFSLITIWRKRLHNYVLWFVSGGIGIIFMMLTNIFNIYEIKLVYWLISYFITTAVLSYIVYSQTKIIRWRWNNYEA